MLLSFYITNYGYYSQANPGTQRWRQTEDKRTGKKREKMIDAHTVQDWSVTEKSLSKSAGERDKKPTI